MKEPLIFVERPYWDRNVVSGPITRGTRLKALGVSYIGGVLGSVAAVGAIEEAKDYVEAHNINPESLSPLEYGAIYHTGNELEGFFHAYASALVLDYLFPRMSNKLKIGVASSLSLASVVAAELKQISGVPDPADIPGGLLGIGLFVGTSLLARRIIKKGSNRQISKW